MKGIPAGFAGSSRSTPFRALLYLPLAPQLYSKPSRPNLRGTMLGSAATPEQIF